MDSGLKQRLVGAAVLVALIVTFLPMLVKEPAPASGVSGLSFNMPAAPEADATSAIILPLGPEGAPVIDVPAREGGTRTEAPARLADEAAAQDASVHAADNTELPPLAAAGRYVVHYAAFATQADADLTARQLQAHGLPAFTEIMILSGRPAVRVRVGPYQSQAEAEIVRVKAAQVRADVQPRVFMLVDPDAAERTVAALESSAAGPLAASAIGFVVQLGAFSNASSATALQQRLRQAGIVAFTETTNTTRGTLTRVNAGPVSSRQEADRLKARVKAAVDVDGIIRPHP